MRTTQTWCSKGLHPVFSTKLFGDGFHNEYSYEEVNTIFTEPHEQKLRGRGRTGFHTRRESLTTRVL